MRKQQSLMAACLLVVLGSLAACGGSGGGTTTVYIVPPAATVAATPTPAGPLILTINQALTTGGQYATTYITYLGCLDTQIVPGFNSAVHEITCQFILKNTGSAASSVNMDGWVLVDIDGVQLSDNHTLDDLATEAQVTLPAGQSTALTIAFNVTVADESPTMYIVTDLHTASGQAIEWEVILPS